MTGEPASVNEKLHILSKDKADLFRLLREEIYKRDRAISRYPRCPGVRPPASWAQQRLWFIDQVAGGNAGYQVPIALRLLGALDHELLRKAFNSVIHRHEVLRTVFVSIDGELSQEITSEVRFAFRVADLRGHGEGDLEQEVQGHKIEEVRGKFDLLAGPLIRARLLRLADEQHVLLVTMHHIVADGWSKGVLTRELAELYRAYQQHRDDPLEPLPIQYADYAQWQRLQWVPGGALEKQLSYWLMRLNSAAPYLELSTDRPRPSVPSYRGENVRVVLDSQLTSQLRELAQRHEMTLFMVLYAGLAILLSRLSGQDDISIGTPVANRQRPELESLIGLFVNTLVLRAAVRGDLRLQEFFKAIKDVTLGAYDNQEIPFEKIVEALQPHRSLDRTPLFQVMLVLHNEPRSELRLPGLTVTRENEVDEQSIVDLWVSLEERGEEIVGSVNYAAELFDRSTIEHWMRCLTVLLRAMVIHGRRGRLGELKILSEMERRHIVESFNSAARAEYLTGELIHEMFEAQAKCNPNSTAVVYEDTRLTYAELNAQANQLARYLRNRGVGPDQLVALCVERSVQMIVGILGVLKAGGAYVPLDVNYPAERLQYMLKDSAPRLLLVGRRQEELLQNLGPELISLDSDWGVIAEESTSNLERAEVGLRSENLAYVIYTSGSTGEPKGVMVEHRNVTRLFAATVDWFGFNRNDVWSVFHSFAFDFSVWEIWGALIYGGRLLIIPYLTARSPRELYHLLCEEKVTVLNQTPTAFKQLIEAQERVPCTHSLRLLIFGGEALELHALRPWVARNGAESPRLVNMYGITETTVHVTYRPIVEEDIEREWRNPVGKNIPDLRIYLLDGYGQPVPIGVAGEIHVGGAGVARGYLNRPGLTSERFVAEPSGADGSGRMYRAGDLGRWRADGTLEYLGRNDHQVKIRGHRIELGEIEAQLVKHPKVKEAVVVARQDVPGERFLVAYVTHGYESKPTTEELRVHSRRLLPEYMVPKAFVTLDTLPVTPNGKLDRRALPAPEVGGNGSLEYEAPRGETEQTIASIWRELLRVDSVGRNDNFFDLGGHSLLATRVVSHVRGQLDMELPLRVIFDATTLAQLSHWVETEKAAQVVQEAFRMDHLTRDLREDISSMSDAQVCEQIARLEGRQERRSGEVSQPDSILGSR